MFQMLIFFNSKLQKVKMYFIKKQKQLLFLRFSFQHFNFSF